MSQTTLNLEGAFEAGVEAAAKTMGATKSECSECEAPIWLFIHTKSTEAMAMNTSGQLHRCEEDKK
mgnify:CR=1 FL=1